MNARSSLHRDVNIFFIVRYRFSKQTMIDSKFIIILIYIYIFYSLEMYNVLTFHKMAVLRLPLNPIFETIFTIIRFKIFFRFSYFFPRYFKRLNLNIGREISSTG